MCTTIFFFVWRCDPTRVMASSFLRFLDHTQRRTTVGRTSLDEWSARRRDLYLTTHNTHKRQTSMPLVGFEPTISAGERPQTYALDRAATGTGVPQKYKSYFTTKHCIYFTSNTPAVSTHPRHQPAAIWVNTTRYCKYSQIFLMMGENIARNM